MRVKLARAAMNSKIFLVGISGKTINTTKNICLVNSLFRQEILIQFILFLHAYCRKYFEQYPKIHKLKSFLIYPKL